MKFAATAAAAFVLAALPAAAQAQDTATTPAMADTAAMPDLPELTVGANVYGPQGEMVGTVDSITNGVVVVNTGTNKANLEAKVFGKDEKGLLISLTKADLDAAVEQAKMQAAATLDAALVAGAPLHSADGVALGTIDKVEGDQVTVNLENGPVILPKNNFATDANGLIVRFTAADLKAAMAGTAG